MKEDLMMKLKAIYKTDNLIFILMCAALGYYGLHYFSIESIPVMIVTAGYILYKAIRLGRLQFDWAMVVLFEMSVLKGMLDQHTGKGYQVMATLAMPVLMYMFGKMLVIQENADSNDSIGCDARVVAAVASLGAGTAVLGILNAKLTIDPLLLSTGYYSMAFTNGKYFVDAQMQYFNYFIVISLIVAFTICIAYKIVSSKLSHRLSLGIIWGVIALAFLYVLRWYVHDIRFAAFKEAVRLMVTQHWGNFNFTVMPVDTSSNMWLDYGRESGIIVFVPLMIYFAISIIDAFKLTFLNRTASYSKVVLLCSFILFNGFYFINSMPFSFKSYWYIGLIVHGMIRAKLEQNVNK